MITTSNPTARQVGYFRITVELLAQLVTEGTHAYEIFEAGVPPGAKVIGCQYDERDRTIMVMVEGDGYPLTWTKEGEQACHFYPQVRQLNREHVTQQSKESEVAEACAVDRPDFPTVTAAIEWMRRTVNNYGITNIRFALVGDHAAAAAYNAKLSPDYFVSADWDISVGGRQAMIGCDSPKS